MANTVQIKRGNNTSVNAHTGPSGEIIYNLDTGRLHAQDGSTAGGNPHALISDVDLKANASVTISAGSGLTGGGTLAANRTLALSSASIASLAKADTAVQSVNGKSGAAVVLVKGDVGLGNVDNTSDANKPISTLTQTALNAKANSSVTVSAGTGLTGGGNLTANRTVALNAASIASLGKADTALQAPGGTTGQILAKNSGTDNDVVWVSSEAATAVSYGPQTLTELQQVQARQNIQADKSYDSIASVAAATVPAFVNAIRTNGYTDPGDGGEALYKRVASEPSHAGKIQSADGAWWELTGWQSDVKSFNVITTPEDSTLALQRAVDYAVENGGSIPISTETLYITEPIIIKPSKTVPADVLSSDVHFKDFRAVNIFGSARHKIKAAPGFVGDEMLRFTYNNTINTQAPMWSEVGGIVLDGSDLVDTAILLEWCMNVEIRRIGIIGTARGVRNIGYGVSNIERSAFRCSSAGVDFSEGGGDSWITKNDFYCPKDGVLIGAAGGNSRVYRNTFNRQDSDLTASDLPTAVRLMPENGGVRSVTVEDNEFCGMAVGVSAFGSSANKHSQLQVIGNHTIPSVGGFLNTCNIAVLDYCVSSSVSRNISGSRSAAQAGVTAQRVPISIRHSEIVSVDGNMIHGSRGTAIEVDTGINCSITANVMGETGVSGASNSSIYLYNTTGTLVTANNASQSSSSYAQKFLEESGTSTGNRGDNLATGYTLKYTLASGSTSIFT